MVVAVDMLEPLLAADVVAETGATAASHPQQDRMDAGEVGAGRGRSWNFSTIRRVELENLLNVSYMETAVPMVDRRSMQSSLRLRSQLKGTTSNEEWERVCVRYTSLLLGLPTTDQCTVPPLLQPLFRCLERSRLEGVNVFSNGAGKLLVYNLLSLLSLDVNVRLATTSDSRHDWCCIRCPQISLSGVVDVALVDGGKWLMLGEVKSDNATGTTQLLAAMQAVAIREPWPYGIHIL